jgi:hypothetical protein
MGARPSAVWQQGQGCECGCFPQFPHFRQHSTPASRQVPSPHVATTGSFSPLNSLQLPWAWAPHAPQLEQHSTCDCRSL